MGSNCSKSQVLENVTNYSIETDCPITVHGVAYREMNILAFEDVKIEKTANWPKNCELVSNNIQI
jgi:hypothetical protein